MFKLAKEEGGEGRRLEEEKGKGGREGERRRVCHAWEEKQGGQRERCGGGERKWLRRGVEEGEGKGEGINRCQGRCS